MYDATTCSPSGLAAAQGTNSIDPDLIDARGELLRLLVGGVILNGVRIENDDIGEVTGLQPSPLFER
jgi:hypothetical protein